jgi:ribulose kinase
VAEKVTLKRSLSLPMMVLYGLGTTIGAGIYKDIEEAKNKMVRIKRIVKPNQKHASIYSKSFRKYKERKQNYV